MKILNSSRKHVWYDPLLEAYRKSYIQMAMDHTKQNIFKDKTLGQNQASGDSLVVRGKFQARRKPINLGFQSCFFLLDHTKIQSC